MPGALDVIRHAVESDCTGIARILDSEIESGFAHFGTEPEGAAPVAEAWRRDHKVYPWLVAVERRRPDQPRADEHVLGFARAAAWKSRGAYDWACESAVYVDESARGRGLGVLLYRRLFDELERRGFRSVVAGVAVPNPASERLHESVGMTNAGTLEAVGYKHGLWRSVRYYTLRLGGDGPPGPSPVGDKTGGGRR